MGRGNARNDPCACNGGRKAKNCCLVDGEWKRRPVSALPKGPATGHSNPDCYLSRFGNCSHKTSREHYFSHGILKLISEEIGGNIITTGPAWVESSDQMAFPPSAFRAKVLCERHNSALGGLDEVATDLYRSICSLDTGWPETAGRRLFNGYDLERWMVKTTIGILLTGQYKARPDQLVKFETISNRTLQRLLYPGQFDDTEGEGLYVERNPEGGFRRVAQSGFTAHWASSKTLAGVTVELRGFRLVLGLDSSIRKHPDFERLAHRPASLAFSKDGCTPRDLIFSWT